MSIVPLITFKAGACDLDSSQNPPKVIPRSTPGYIYLYEEDDLINFCWRPRSTPMSQPELKLVMVPTDGNFVPYNLKSDTGPGSRSTTNGRIFALKFQSSTQRHLFWMQSKSQDPNGDPEFFSPRDIRIGWCVNQLLQGSDMNVGEALANISNDHPTGDSDDQEMQDAAPEGPDASPGASGGGNSSMGNPGNEGEESREGGADGGRDAATPSDDAAAAVQNFLRSMQGNQALSTQSSQPQGQIFTTLSDLLPPSTTVPVVESADAAIVDALLSHIPPVLLLHSQKADRISSVDPSAETTKAAIEALSLDQKKQVLIRVLRSPQFSQSLGSLTSALRDGGLPTISEALQVPVRNGGYIQRGGVPLGGGDAVEAFLNGVKEAAEKEMSTDAENMETD